MFSANKIIPIMSSIKGYDTFLKACCCVVAYIRPSAVLFKLTHWNIFGLLTTAAWFWSLFATIKSRILKLKATQWMFAWDIWKHMVFSVLSALTVNLNAHWWNAYYCTMSLTPPTSASAQIVQPKAIMYVYLHKTQRGTCFLSFFFFFFSE